MEGRAEPLGIVLFDGDCAVCDRAVLWLLDRDEGRRLRFAPLQGETAAALRARHPQIPADLDTIVFVEGGGEAERVFLRSRALLRVCEGLARPPGWLALLRAMPTPLADLGYRIFARLRYRLFGRLEHCRVPAPEDRARFLA